MTGIVAPQSARIDRSTNLVTLLKGVIVGAVMAVSLIPGWMAVAPLLFRGTLSPHMPVCLGPHAGPPMAPGGSLPMAQDSSKAFRKSSLAIALCRQIVRSVDDLRVLWFGIVRGVLVPS